MIKHHAVTSSNIREVAYDGFKQELLVVFLSGKPYVYEGVSQRVFNEFLEADSKGSYLNAKIKKNYPCRQLGMDGDDAIEEFVGTRASQVTVVKIADLIRDDCKMVVNF